MMYLSKHYNHLFPDLVSYERFVQSSKRIMVPLMVFLKTNALGTCRGISFIDSTTVKVCHVKREKQHQVLKGLAAKGKSTMGSFFVPKAFGIKLHLIINDQEEILSFYLTSNPPIPISIGITSLDLKALC
nr:transposase [Sinomicrobium pectinilyticum]